jgi:hypothetical protein
MINIDKIDMGRGASMTFLDHLYVSLSFKKTLEERD